MIISGTSFKQIFSLNISQTLTCRFHEIDFVGKQDTLFCYILKLNRSQNNRSLVTGNLSSVQYMLFYKESYRRITSDIYLARTMTFCTLFMQKNNVYYLCISRYRKHKETDVFFAISLIFRKKYFCLPQLRRFCQWIPVLFSLLTITSFKLHRLLCLKILRKSGRVDSCLFNETIIVFLLGPLV